jgi:endonuclease/exonuclease/phosphatase family metal-dependent hydrolase
MGDLNTKIGKEHVYQQVVGKHSLHENTNDNGELVCDYAMANDMKIISTYYQHKRIHTGTWTSPDGTILNQTDHVLVDAKKKSITEDVRTMRLPNCDSDHVLVRTIIKQKFDQNTN